MDLPYCEMSAQKCISSIYAWMAVMAVSVLAGAVVIVGVGARERRDK